MSSAELAPRIALRPRSLLGSADLGLHYLARHARIFAGGLGWALGAAVAGFSGLWFEIPLPWIVGVIAGIGVLVERMTAVVGAAHLLGARVSWTSALGRCVRSPLSLLGAALWNPLPLHVSALSVVDEAWGGLAALLYLAWPPILGRYTFVAHASLLERQSWTGALKRSDQLNRGRLGRSIGLIGLGALGRLALVWTVDRTGVFLLEVVLQLGTPAWLDQYGLLPVVSAAWVGSGVVLAVVRLMEYIDARTEREGWDLQVRFRYLASRSGGERWTA